MARKSNEMSRSGSNGFVQSSKKMKELFIQQTEEEDDDGPTTWRRGLRKNRLFIDIEDD